MAQYGFGAGILWGTQLTDASGTAVANPTPVKLGELQDVSIDISFDTKLLRGQNQFPVAVGRGSGKVSGKSKFARINGQTLNALIFGQTLSAGEYGVVNATATTTVAASTTITPPNSGTFSKDLGVVDAVTGLPWTRVASAPATLQYAVNEGTGVYTFVAGDAGKLVYISYSYLSALTSADKITVNNVPMGYAPSFRAAFLMPFQGKNLTLTLPNCIGSKLTIATKLDDFLIPDFDFEAFADAGGNVIQIGTSE